MWIFFFMNSNNEKFNIIVMRMIFLHFVHYYKNVYWAYWHYKLVTSYRLDLDLKFFQHDFEEYFSYIMGGNPDYKNHWLLLYYWLYHIMLYKYLNNNCCTQGHRAVYVYNYHYIWARSRNTEWYIYTLEPSASLNQIWSNVDRSPMHLLIDLNLSNLISFISYMWRLYSNVETKTASEGKFGTIILV